MAAHEPGDGTAVMDVESEQVGLDELVEWDALADFMADIPAGEGTEGRGGGQSGGRRRRPSVEGPMGGPPPLPGSSVRVGSNDSHHSDVSLGGGLAPRASLAPGAWPLGLDPAGFGGFPGALGGPSLAQGLIGTLGGGNHQCQQ